MTRALPCILLLVLLACSPGCGKKVWPEPQASQDAFHWKPAEVSRDKSCLFVEAQVSGAVKNIASITVEIELLDAECPECPFSMDLGRTVHPGDPGFRRAGSNIQLYLCGLNPDQGYRFRLVGRNVFPGLAPAVSRVYVAAP
ncbi:MAG: hypothetical protein ACOCVM_05060 [Desulfovibrionaceae bacterium]